MTLDMQSARSGGGGAPSWLRRMESNHRRLVYETSVNTNSLRRKRPGDLYTASRCDTVSTRDGNRTRVSALSGRRTYRYATPAYILSRKRPRIFFSCTLYEYRPHTAMPIYRTGPHTHTEDEERRSHQRTVSRSPLLAKPRYYTIHVPLCQALRRNFLLTFTRMP